jgi:hypothetical protein
MIGTDVGTYPSEADLVNRLVASLRRHDGPIAIAGLAREFPYRNGRADVVVSTEGQVIAFEAKLYRWRWALHQAYRDTCFAHQSFVVLPWSQASIAMRYEAEFDRRGVGLCSIDDNGRLIILKAAMTREPLQDWLSEAAAAAASHPAS